MAPYPNLLQNSFNPSQMRASLTWGSQAGACTLGSSNQGSNHLGSIGVMVKTPL